MNRIFITHAHKTLPSLLGKDPKNQIQRTETIWSAKFTELLILKYE